jgi:hypothetical protein
MKSQFDALCLQLDHKGTKVISRAQLPRLLAKVNQPVFARLVQAHYGLQLTDGFSRWLSGDCKELRGSILKGQQRGEVCVSIIAQADQSVVAKTHYNGIKESERAVVSNLLNENGLMSRKIVLDALHLTPALPEDIGHNKGTYLIGFKGNQPHLLRLYFIQTMLRPPPCQQRVAPPLSGAMRAQRNAPTRAFPLAGCKRPLAGAGGADNTGARSAHTS